MASPDVQQMRVYGPDEGEEEDSEEWNEWTKSRPVPVGANDSDTEGCKGSCMESKDELDLLDPLEVRKIREEHEHLTSALLALTSHFAQVQFRIQQISQAPEKDKDVLLKSLEEFTFRGIPSAVVVPPTTSLVRETLMEGNPQVEHAALREKIRVQKEKQQSLIFQLKTQLEELEEYAYASGDSGLPQSVLLERHRIIVEQLRDKLNLNVDQIEKATDQDLREHVDQAISEFVNPLKMKEQLVEQLKTQISDLERFIEYLHKDKASLKKTKRPLGPGKPNSSANTSHTPLSETDDEEEEELRNKTVMMMKRALALIQMFTVAQFGCSPSSSFGKPPGCASSDAPTSLLSQLDSVVSKIKKLALDLDREQREIGLSHHHRHLSSDCEDEEEEEMIPMLEDKGPALTALVRKELAPLLATILEDGLSNCSNTGVTEGFLSLANCFSTKSRGSGFISAWDLILKYYHIKNGEKYNKTPARKLSQSFGLEIIGGTTISNKQLLLSTIDNIITSHSRYKRSGESHWKAFVSAALNCRKLGAWIRLIVRTQEVMEQYYQPWSFVLKGEFEKVLQTLEKLSSLNLNLPVDLAIRQFQNIKDAFQ